MLENISQLIERNDAVRLFSPNVLLQALGLQSLRAAEQAKHKPKEFFSHKTDNYTGTLKTVIKLNRDKKKGGRISSIKMTLHNKSKPTIQETPAPEEVVNQDSKEVGTDYK